VKICHQRHLRHNLFLHWHSRLPRQVPQSLTQASDDLTPPKPTSPRYSVTIPTINHHAPSAKPHAPLLHNVQNRKSHRPPTGKVPLFPPFPTLSPPSSPHLPSSSPPLLPSLLTLPLNPVPHHASNNKPRISEGSYYEAHQQLRVIASRYVKSANWPAATEILHGGALALLKAGQGGSGGDLGLFLVDVLNKGEVRVEGDVKGASSLDMGGRGERRDRIAETW